MAEPGKATQRPKAQPQAAPAEGSTAADQPAEGQGAAGEPSPPERQLLPVVGIGASAGGLDAFRELLQSLPADTGMAFVIVQHLVQDQKSMLPNILARATAMPVLEVVDATPVLANHVYVMSPQVDVEYAAGALVVREREPGQKHMPVDRLFVTLAEGLGDLSVGVILSGTDGDGSTGARHIQAAGGVTFAQDESAQFDGMPRSAIDKGTVDFVLPPREIAHKLVDLAGRRAAAVARPRRSNAGSGGACCCETSAASGSTGDGSKRTPTSGKRRIATS